MKEKIGKVVPVLGLILFLYIIWDIGLNKIISAFLSIPLLFFISALTISIPRIIFYGYKWWFICKKQKMEFSILYLTRVFLMTLFYGIVTPLAIGLHIRIYYLRKQGKYSLEKCLANSLMDSTTGFIVGVFLALIGSLILIEHAPGVFPPVLLVFIFYTVAFVVLMKKKRGSKLFDILIKPFIPQKYKEKMEKSLEMIYEDIPRIRDLFWPFIIEGVIWVLGALQVYIIALVFSVDVPFYVFIFISIISVIATGILPISIGGLGVREGMFVFLMSTFGVKPEVAFAISLGGFFVKTLIPGVFGLIISFDERVFSRYDKKSL